MDKRHVPKIANTQVEAADSRSSFQELSKASWAQIKLPKQKFEGPFLKRFGATLGEINWTFIISKFSTSSKCQNHISHKWDFAERVVDSSSFTLRGKKLNFKKFQYFTWYQIYFFTIKGCPDRGRTWDLFDFRLFSLSIAAP